MKRALISKHGGLEVLQVIEEAIPQPKAGEALIRVQAAVSGKIVLTMGD